MTSGSYFSEIMINRSVTAATFSIKVENLYDYPVENKDVTLEESLYRVKETKSRRLGRDTRRIHFSEEKITIRSLMTPDEEFDGV